MVLHEEPRLSGFEHDGDEAPIVVQLVEVNVASGKASGKCCEGDVVPRFDHADDEARVRVRLGVHCHGSIIDTLQA